MPDADLFAAAGLLDGLEGDARAERVALLRWLRDDQGVPDDILRRTTENGTVVLAAAGRNLGTQERYSVDDIADQTGIAPALLVELLRSSGLPTPADDSSVELGDTHFRTAQTIQSFVEAGVRPEQMLAVARVLGTGLSQAADLMRQTVLELTIEPGMSETDLAATFAYTSDGLLPLLSPLLEDLMRLQLYNAAREEVVTADERMLGALPGARDVAVGFADLVGFTKLGEQLEPTELERVAGRLVSLTGDVLEPPVRLVKSVGDAVLLVSPDPLALARTAFGLLERVEDQGPEFPQVRIGLAYGPAAARAGDWFGRPINLASRLTGVARAGSVVADAAMMEAIGEESFDVVWSRVGERRLKGIRGGVKLFRARPRAALAP